MNRFFLLAGVCAAALVGVGCGKSSSEAVEGADAGTMSALSPSSTPSSPAASAAPSTGVVAAASTDVPDEPPTERRAERKAVSEITHANYKTEYAKLQKELAAP